MTNIHTNTYTLTLTHGCSTDSQNIYYVQIYNLASNFYRLHVKNIPLFPYHHSPQPQKKEVIPVLATLQGKEKAYRDQIPVQVSARPLSQALILHLNVMHLPAPVGPYSGDMEHVQEESQLLTPQSEQLSESRGCWKMIPLPPVHRCHTLWESPGV